MWSDVGLSRNGILAVPGKHQLPGLWHGPVQIGSRPPPYACSHAFCQAAREMGSESTSRPRPSNGCDRARGTAKQMPTNDDE